MNAIRISGVLFSALISSSYFLTWVDRGCICDVFNLTNKSPLLSTVAILSSIFTYTGLVDCARWTISWLIMSLFLLFFDINHHDEYANRSNTTHFVIVWCMVIPSFVVTQLWISWYSVLPLLLMLFQYVFDDAVEHEKWFPIKVFFALNTLLLVQPISS